jgi:hypothetical protein
VCEVLCCYAVMLLSVVCCLCAKCGGGNKKSDFCDAAFLCRSVDQMADDDDDVEEEDDFFNDELESEEPELKAPPVAPCPIPVELFLQGMGSRKVDKFPMEFSRARCVCVTVRCRQSSPFETHDANAGYSLLLGCICGRVVLWGRVVWGSCMAGCVFCRSCQAVRGRGDEGRRPLATLLPLTRRHAC